MANPTPRADALRQMREAKFEAEQRRLKQESKPAEAPKRKADPTATEVSAAKPAKAKADAVAKAPDVADIASAVGAEISDAAPSSEAGATKAPSKRAAPKKSAAKAAPKKAVAKKASASTK